MKATVSRVLLFILISGIFPSSSMAVQSYYLHQQYLSARIQGMGGAFTAVADDYNTLYLNPAGLARLETWQINMNIQGMLTPSILSFSKDLKDAGKDPVKIQDTLQKNFGQHYASRVGLGATWSWKGFGIGFNPLDLTIEADVHGTAGATVGVQAYQDSTFQFGLAWNFFETEKTPEADESRTPSQEKKAAEAKPAEPTPDGAVLADEEKKKADEEAKKKAEEEQQKKLEEERRLAKKKAKEEEEQRFSNEGVLSVGIAPKAVYRAYYEKDLSILDLLNTSDLFRPEDASEGLAFDVDIGFLYTFRTPENGFFSFTKFLKPTIGLAVLNAVDSGFATNGRVYSKLYGKESAKIQYEDRLQRRINIGTKLELPQFWLFKPRFVFDVRDLGHRYVNSKKTLHMGFELLWKAFGWLRGGYRVGISQGYWTAGVSAKLGIFNLDAASCSEDIGTKESPKENRRYMARASLDF